MDDACESRARLPMLLARHSFAARAVLAPELGAQVTGRLRTPRGQSRCALVDHCRSAKFLKDFFFFIRVYVTTVYDRTSNEWPGSALSTPHNRELHAARDRESAHRGRRGVRGGPGMAWGMAAGVRPQSRLILDLAALSSLFTWGWEAAGSAGLAGPHAQSARQGG